MRVQKRTQKKYFTSCIKDLFSPYSAPIAMKALVPVLFGAPDGFSQSSLIARSRSIKNDDQEGLSSSSFINRFPIEISLWSLPVRSRNDSCPVIVSPEYGKSLHASRTCNATFQRCKHRD